MKTREFSKVFMDSIDDAYEDHIYNDPYPVYRAEKMDFIFMLTNGQEL